MSASDSPVETGDTYVVEIVELGDEGAGVGYVNDFAVLVPDASLGETVRAEVDEVGSTFARASVVDRQFDLS